MMSRWAMSPHDMPTAYGNAINCSRPGQHHNACDELRGADGKNLVSRTARTKAVWVAGGHDGRVGDVDVVEMLQA